MGRKCTRVSDLGLEIKAALLRNGITQERAMKALGIATTAWNQRMYDPNRFRAGEIRQLRKLIPEEVCDRITK